MDKSEMRRRTSKFALDVIRFTDSLPRKRSADVIGKQLLRCGTSVGANYHSALRARSRAEFVAKMGIVLEEADEALYWMGLLEQGSIVNAESVRPLAAEANELVSIVAASIMTAKRSRPAAKSEIINHKS